MNWRRTLLLLCVALSATANAATEISTRDLAPLPDPPMQYAPLPLAPRGAETIYGVPPLPLLHAAEGLAGSVLLQVAISIDGGMRDIVVLDEFPQNGGFGKRALERLEKFRFAPGDAGFVRTVMLRFPREATIGLQYVEAYPSAASLRREAGSPGMAIVQTAIEVSGKIREVYLLDEDPVGAGFGQMALEQARKQVFEPATVPSTQTRAYRFRPSG